MKRPLIVTDEGLIATPMIKNALAALKNAALFGAVRGNPAFEPCRGGTSSVPRRRPRRRRGVRRRIGARCRQGRGVHVGTDPAAVGFRGHRRLVDAGGSGRHRAGRRGANHRGHRLRSRPRRRHPQRGDTSEKDHLSPADDAAHRHFGRRTHRRIAARGDGGYRHRRLRPLLRSILRAGIPSAGGWRRARRHAAHPSLPAARLRGRQGHRGTRADAGRRVDGRHGVSEGSRRRACHRAPGGIMVQHPSRPHQCRHPSLRHDVQPQRHRRPRPRSSRGYSICRSAASTVSSPGCCKCAANSAYRIRWPTSA